MRTSMILQNPAKIISTIQEYNGSTRSTFKRTSVLKPITEVNVPIARSPGRRMTRQTLSRQTLTRQPNQDSRRQTINRQTLTRQPIQESRRQTINRQTLSHQPIQDFRRDTIRPISQKHYEPIDKRLPKESAAPPKSSNPVPFPKPLVFKCNICSKSFNYLSNYNSHKKTHIENVSANACTYCDRKFAIRNALDIHLKTNCTKISSANRRKLLSADDLKNSINAVNTYKKQTAVSTGAYPKRRTNITTTDSDSLTASENSHLDESIALRSSTKKTPHSGIYRTPSKSIRCTICNTFYSDILSFTQHLETHENHI